MYIPLERKAAKKAFFPSKQHGLSRYNPGIRNFYKFPTLCRWDPEKIQYRFVTCEIPEINIIIEL